MSSKPPENNHKIGFLALHETAKKDGFLCALLVTDSRGIPLEFRCTHPVKPTPVQSILYGDGLVPYIGVHLCGIPLASAVQNTPTLLVVQQQYLIDVRESMKTPVVCVRRAGEAITLKSEEDPRTSSTRSRLDSPTGKFQQIVVMVHPGFSGDMSTAQQLLTGVFSSFDPVEPFDRVSRAVQLLGSQDQRFQ